MGLHICSSSAYALHCQPGFKHPRRDAAEPWHRAADGCKAVMGKRGTAEKRGDWKQSKAQLAHRPGCNASLRKLQRECEGTDPAPCLLPICASDPPVTCSPFDPHSQSSVIWQPSWRREGDQDRVTPGDNVAITVIYPPGQRQVSELTLNQECTARCHRERPSVTQEQNWHAGPEGMPCSRRHMQPYIQYGACIFNVFAWQME